MEVLGNREEEEPFAGYRASEGKASREEIARAQFRWMKNYEQGRQVLFHFDLLTEILHCDLKTTNPKCKRI